MVILSIKDAEQRLQQLKYSEQDTEQMEPSVKILGTKQEQMDNKGVACLKFNVRNCGDVVNAFMQKREHLQ